MFQFQETWSTKQVSKIFDIPARRLSARLWAGNTHVPQKDDSGRFRWTRSDIELIAWELGHQRKFHTWSLANPELTPPMPKRED